MTGDHRRRSLVTGGAGFIGSHLVERLLADGDDVLVIDDLSTGDASNLPAQASLETVDIATADLDTLLRRWRPSLVFHLAAQSSVPRSMAEPLRDLAVNVTGTHRVAAASRSSGAHRLVFVSSGGAVYGDTGEHAATEQTAVAPSSYYGVHKLAAEGHVALSGLPFAIARPSNVYGARQAAGLEGAVVAAFVAGCRAGRIRIDGDGQQTRDFIHVGDVVAALVHLGEAEVGDAIWNVSTGRSMSILDLAAAIERAVGRPLEHETGPVRSGDVRHSAMSSSRLRSSGWRPQVSLDTGISALVTAGPGRPGG
jgi:UDP-glucose 4-epimerase